MKHLENAIEDMKNTLEINKQVLSELISNNFSKEMVISFNIKPDEIITMDVFTQKLVVNKEEYISVNIQHEV